MTNRDFYNAVITANISDEITAFATAEVDKLNIRNEKRRNTLNKTQEANTALRADMVAFIKENGAKVASEIGSEFSISTQKASALLKQAVDKGELKVEDVKVKGKGSVKSYSIAE